jgi:hypothetical protein
MKLHDNEIEFERNQDTIYHPNTLPQNKIIKNNHRKRSMHCPKHGLELFFDGEETLITGQVVEIWRCPDEWCTDFKEIDL